MSHTLKKTECDFCLTELTIHEQSSGNVCSKLECKTQLAVKIKKQEQEKNSFLDAQAGQLADFLVQDQHPHFRIPYNTSPFGKTSKAHARHFRKNLKAAIRAAALALSKRSESAAPVHHSTEKQYPPATAQLLNDGCATCGGRCCNRGSSHAFLDEKTMIRVLEQRPDDSPSKIFRDYLRRMPTYTFKSSCVFQGRHGCALPPPMRSDICHEYECKLLVEVRNESLSKETQTALLVATDEENVRAIALSVPGQPIHFIETPALKPAADNTFITT